MIVHFDTAALARKHLDQYGWTLCKSGAWVSRDKTCKATIHPVPGSDVVAIFYSEIERPAA